MSYDIWLETPPGERECGHCGGTGRVEGGGQDVGDLDWNYTSNCAPMWRKAGADLAEFEGKAAGECAPILSSAIEALEADPETYRAMNPSNGWGDYDSLVASLKRLLEGLQGNPHMIVSMWR